MARYLSQLDTADLQEPSEALALKTERLKEKLAKLNEEMEKHLGDREAGMLASPSQQISLTDPDSRSWPRAGSGSGVVGYNVQVAVDTEHHLIVAHEVTNVGNAPPGGRTPQVLLHRHGERARHAPLLDERMPGLRHQASMHHR